jgi:hypothetical protein
LANRNIEGAPGHQIRNWHHAIPKSIGCAVTKSNDAKFRSAVLRHPATPERSAVIKRSLQDGQLAQVSIGVEQAQRNSPFVVTIFVDIWLNANALSLKILREHSQIRVLEELKEKSCPHTLKATVGTEQFLASNIFSQRRVKLTATFAALLRHASSLFKGLSLYYTIF